MSFLVVIPGTMLPARPLLGVLREDHEARAADHAMRTAWRLDQGIPSTPDIDWQEQKRRLTAMLELVDSQTPDAALVALGHQAGLVAMSPAPKDPGPWVPPAGIEGVSVRPRALSAKDRNRLRSAWQSAVQIGDSEAAATDLVCAAIAEVSGVEVYGDAEVKPLALSPDTMAPIWECGLGAYLLTASLHLTSLDPKKALRSGERPPQT